MAVTGFFGCGYHLKGGGLEAPEGVASIAVFVLDNQTTEIGIETVFTSDLIYEFTRSKVLQVVGKETSDAVLKGGIVSVTTDTITHTETFASDERRVLVTLDLICMRKDGKVLWADSNLQDSEEYDVASDKPTTDANKREAIETISGRMAEKVHDRILQDF